MLADLIAAIDDAPDKLHAESTPATGALIGRAVAAALKVAIGVGMAALTLFAAMV